MDVTTDSAPAVAVNSVSKPKKKMTMMTPKKSVATAATATTVPAPISTPVLSAAQDEDSGSMADLSVESWPPSLQAYVERVFQSCSQELHDKAMTELRKLIIEKHAKGELLTTDWNQMDLPSICYLHGTKKKMKMPKGKHMVDVAPTADELSKRRNRLKRFQSNRSETPSTPSSATEPMSWDQTVVGTSTKLEKQYLRLTAAPDPSTVRPLRILKQTLELLKRKWKEEENYAYICEQFKSMRQDLTVQRIRNDFTVQVYEIHARIALEKGDLGEYNQCQTQLKSLYQLGIPGNVMEFTAYRILYFLHTQNWADINSEMAKMSLKQKESQVVQHALQVRSALATSNYHRFFTLFLQAPNMGGYLMDQFIERERVRALVILCKAYRPNLSLDYIMKELAFDEGQQLSKFLVAHNLKHDNTTLDTRLSYAQLLEGLKKYQKVDIKGQL